MATIALSGNDTVSLNNRVLTDFATGTPIELTYPNEIASVKTGKSGNAIYGINQSGRQAELKLHMIRGSADDRYLNGLLQTQEQNFAGTVLLIGQFIKKLGDGKGNVSSDTHVAAGGIFTKFVEAKTNVEGEAEQSIAMYTIRFANCVRALT